jgi:succinate dehydrogenase / fumarate reductase, cytochrome b subunit
MRHNLGNTQIKVFVREGKLKVATQITEKSDKEKVKESCDGNAVKPNNSQTEFLLRRLHSLAGLFPLSLFLVFHLSANNAAIKGPEAFNFVVNTLRSTPYLPLVEFTILGLPILFHGLYGLVITPNFTRNKLDKYSQVRNWTYYLQRVTGVIIFTYIAVHIWQFRFNENLDFEAVARPLRQPGWAVAYLIGIAATVYHFANGLWNFLISWGITVGKKAQQVSGAICLAIGLGVFVIGLSALWAFYSSTPSPAAANSARAKDAYQSPINKATEEVTPNQADTQAQKTTGLQPTGQVEVKDQSNPAETP